MNKKIGRGAAVAVAMACSSAVAADPFALEVTVNDQQAPPQSQSFGFANVETAIEQLDFDRLSQDFGYQGDEEVDAVMNFRGLEGVTLSFDFQSGDLVFTVPGVKLDSSGSSTRTFQGIGQTAMDLVLLGALPTVVMAFSAAILLDAAVEASSHRRSGIRA